MTDAPYLTKTSDHILLRVHVSPCSKQNVLLGTYDGKLKLSLAAPPADGKANKELIRFIADVLGCSKSSVTLTKGLASKEKVLEISGLTLKDAADAIDKHLPPA